MQEKFLSIITVLLITIAIMSCDEYQSQEYQISDFDNTACQLLADSTADTVSTVSLMSFDTTWTNENISPNVGIIVDSLLENDIEVRSLTDLTNLITTPVTEDTLYVAFVSSGGAGVIFSSQSILLNIFNQSGSILMPRDEKISFETMGGCTVTDSNDRQVPLIRTRQQYDLGDQQYLIQLIKIEQTTSNNIYMSILYQ